MTDVSALASKEIHAPHAAVWQALTDPEQMGRWLLSPHLGATLALRDGVLLVGMGGMEVPLAEWTLVEPGRTVRLLGMPDGELAALLSADATAGASATTVSVALEAGDAAQPVLHEERRAVSARAWRLALENLGAVVAGAPLPHPQGHVAALFGFRREGQRFAVERSIWIAAPVERVWQAISDPVEMERWFSPGTAWTLTAKEEGARLFVRGPQGEEMYTQVFERFNSPHELVMATLPNADGNVERTGYRLQAEGDGTRLRLMNWGYGSLTDDARHSAMEQNAFGFGMMLDNIRALLEGKSLPVPGGF